MKITFEGNAFAHSDCSFCSQPMSLVPMNLFPLSLHLSSLSSFRPRTLSTSQWIRTMKVTAILLFAVCLQVHATSWSQTVSFTGKDVPLEQVFASVKKQTGFGFFYKAEILQNTHKVTMDVKNLSLEEFMDICLRDEPLSYKVVGQTVFITKKDETHTNAELPGGPGSEIKGRVTNSHGEPLVNANIVVKRTGRGTVTNANGEFTLHSVAPQDIVAASFVGYKTQTLSLKGRSSLTMILDPATNDLDKVVVQAYGTTSQRLATGNIGVVRAEDISKQPIMNVLEAVQGQVPGVVVTNNSGYASGSIKVEIRGRNTIGNFPADPLYIIDGVPMTILDLNGAGTYANGNQGPIQAGIASPAVGQSPFFNINPSDIESIEILKDADATAIYGSRGSNGVILISTKKGKAGKTKFDIDIYQGMSKATRQYQLLNTQQYVSMRKEALANDGLPVDINNAPDLVAWDTTRYTNWQKYLWEGTGKTTDLESSLSGGDAKTTFRIAGGFHRLTDITTVSGANTRGSASLNLNHHSLNQRLGLSLTVLYSYTSSNLTQVPGNPTLPPNAPSVFDKLGNLNFLAWDPVTGSNPFGPLLQPYHSSTNLLNSNLTVNFEILKGLVFKTSLGYNNIQNHQTQVMPIASQDPQINPKGQSHLGYSFVNNVIAEPQLEYNRFISKGKLTIMAGASSQTNTTSSIASFAIGFTNDALLASLNSAPIQTITNSTGEYKYDALFGRATYNWENKYIVNANLRRDGSSRFGPGRQYGNFGSLGGAWIFSEEGWVKKNLSFLSFGKLRGSYGITGGDQITDYAYLTAWGFDYTSYNGNLILTPLKHTDSTLHWQVNRKKEIALALNFFQDRVSIEASWYQNRCNDQLVPFPTPAFTGFTDVTSNSPANVQNTGWEFIASGKLIDHPTFKLTTKFNIGINRNKLLSYPNFSQSPFFAYLEICQSLNIRKLLHITGVDPQTGFYTFQDKNHDGLISVNPGPTDDRYNKDMSPKFDGGFNTTISFKNWSLSLFFYFKKQLGVNAYSNTTIPGDISNQPVEVFEHHWKKPGDIATFARFTNSPVDPSYGNYSLYSDASFTDASFIRLQNVFLSYTLSENTMKKYGIGNSKIFLQAQNLLLLTHYKGVDPEVQNFGGLPIPRIITIGISCNF